MVWGVEAARLPLIPISPQNMAPGYIYILQNEAFGAYVVKIGLTTREPDVRAREIYSGATGVPLPFEVAAAYSVGDCKLAEKRIHKRLFPYRLNTRREFFRASPSVAAAIVHETCAEINSELGQSPPQSFVFGSSSNTMRRADTVAEPETSTAATIILVPPGRWRESPVGTSTLTPGQLDRARILGMMLARVHPKTHQEWQDGFTRDAHPERELRIWEHIAKAFLTIEQVEFASDDLKTEAFALLLARSWSATNDVLREMKLKHFSPRAAKRLLRSYELRPLPLVIRRNRRAD